MSLDDRMDFERIKVRDIVVGLDSYTILITSENDQQALTLQFDSPSRKFLFSVIALVITEMKKAQKPVFVPIRKHEGILLFLDQKLSQDDASEDSDRMWDKIRKAWRYNLPKLAKAPQFKILDRPIIRYPDRVIGNEYECSEAECDMWATLFQYDDRKGKKWNYKVGVDSKLISITLEDLHLVFKLSLIHI